MAEAAPPPLPGKGLSRRDIALIALVVLIVAALGWLDWIFMGQHPSDEASGGQQGLAAIEEGVRSLHAGDPDYGPADSDLVPSLIRSKAVPSDLIDGDRLQTYMKTPLSVVSDGPTFTVTYFNMDKDDCAKMASGYAGTPGNGLVSVRINGQKILPLPVSVQAAVNACPKGGAVAWTFQ